MIRIMLAIAALLGSSAIPASIVRVDTPLGHFYIDLLENEAPGTVANFLNYVRDGDYDNSIIHRVDNGFVTQGGAFTFVDGEFGEVPVDDNIQNEFNVSNLRGTVAMAKVGGDPDSANSQWFINMDDDNAAGDAQLDTQNGGFTVFGRVLGDGMKVVDAINSVGAISLGQAALTEVPIIWNGGIASVDDLTSENLVIISITEVSGFEINPGMSGTWFNAATPGQGWLIDIIDQGDRKEVFVAWFTYDVNAATEDDSQGFGSTQHRWFTASGSFVGNTATLTISRNSGGVFNDPAATILDTVGTMTIEFSACDAGTLSFDFDDPAAVDDTVSIVRLSPDTFCSTIALPAQ